MLASHPSDPSPSRCRCLHEAAGCCISPEPTIVSLPPTFSLPRSNGLCEYVGHVCLRKRSTERTPSHICSQAPRETRYKWNSLPTTFSDTHPKLKPQTFNQQKKWFRVCACGLGEYIYISCIKKQSRWDCHREGHQMGNDLCFLILVCGILYMFLSSKFWYLDQSK